jgi:hypothetical protein
LAKAVWGISNPKRRNMIRNHDPEDYFEAVKRRYTAYQEEGQRREDAGEGEYWPVIQYYTSAGEPIRVDYVMRDAGSDVLELKGADQWGVPCDVITTTRSAQIVIKLIAAPSMAERKPIGFKTRIPDDA